MRELPRNLASLDRTHLEAARDGRDEHLASLFRRWPALSRRELGELRLMWHERVRIAKHVGNRRTA